MAIKNEDEVRKSRKVAIAWVVISLSSACFLGAIGRAFFLGNPISNPENVFIEMIGEVFTNRLGIPFIGGLLLCGILAAIMSTADSQLLVTASSISEDVYKGVIRKMQVIRACCVSAVLRCWWSAQLPLWSRWIPTAA